MTTPNTSITRQPRKSVVFEHSDAWANFLTKLVEVLKERETGDLFTLQAKESGEWIQFATESRSFRIEVKSNFYRDDDDQLSVEQVIGLADIGWSAPTGNPEQSTPENDLYGSPNYFVDVKAPLKLKVLETLIARTFVEVFGVSEPDALSYQGFDCEGNSLSCPSLGIKPYVYEAESSPNPKFPQLFLNVLKETTGISE